MTAINPIEITYFNGIFYSVC